MRKLTSFFTREGGRLRLTGFSTSPSIVVLKDSKPHASTSGQSVGKLDNLSCVRISEWKYTFQVTYVQGNLRRLSTSTGGAVEVLEVIKWKVKKVEVNIKTRHITCYVTSILKVIILQFIHLSISRSTNLTIYLSTYQTYLSIFPHLLFSTEPKLSNHTEYPKNLVCDFVYVLHLFTILLIHT